MIFSRAFSKRKIHSFQNFLFCTYFSYRQLLFGPCFTLSPYIRMYVFQIYERANLSSKFVCICVYVRESRYPLKIALRFFGRFKIINNSNRARIACQMKYTRKTARKKRNSTVVESERERVRARLEILLTLQLYSLESLAVLSFVLMANVYIFDFLVRFSYISNR